MSAVYLLQRTIYCGQDSDASNTKFRLGDRMLALCTSGTPISGKYERLYKAQFRSLNCPFFKLAEPASKYDASTPAGKGMSMPRSRVLVQ